MQYPTGSLPSRSCHTTPIRPCRAADDSTQNPVEVVAGPPNMQDIESPRSFYDQDSISDSHSAANRSPIEKFGLSANNERKNNLRCAVPVGLERNHLVNNHPSVWHQP
jgi:hypothetical protein